MRMGSDYLGQAHIAETENRPLRMAPEKPMIGDEYRLVFRDGFSDGHDGRNRVELDPPF